MINLAQAHKENAIEEIVCKPFEKAIRTPMSDDLTKLMIQLMFADEKFKIPEAEKPFLFNVIEKRIEYCFSFNVVDHRLILALAVITESPGTAIMYLWYLQYWCKQNGVKEVDLDLFCERIFPFGFPIKSDMQKIWDSQKVSTEKNGCLNLVDIEGGGRSCQFEQVKEKA